MPSPFVVLSLCSWLEEVEQRRDDKWCHTPKRNGSFSRVVVAARQEDAPALIPARDKKLLAPLQKHKNHPRGFSGRNFYVDHIVTLVVLLW